MGEPGTPSSGSMQRRRNFEALENNHTVNSPVSSASFTWSRSVRRRVDFDHHSQPSSTELPYAESRVENLPHSFEFVVYLPNRTSVDVRVPAEVCRSLTVQGFVKLVKMELGRSSEYSKVKQKQRGIVWGDHVEIQDFHGSPIKDGEFASSYESKSGRVLLLYVSWNFALIRTCLQFTLNPNPKWQTSLTSLVSSDYVTHPLQQHCSHLFFTWLNGLWQDKHPDTVHAHPVSYWILTLVNKLPSFPNFG